MSDVLWDVWVFDANGDCEDVYRALSSEAADRCRQSKESDGFVVEVRPHEAE